MSKKTTVSKKTAKKIAKKTSRRPPQCPAYTRTTVRKIVTEALKNKDTTRVRHICPRAYCVAKPAPHCAVFVTPPCDREPQLRPLFLASISIHNSSVAEVAVGDWCSLAYCTRIESGETRMIINLTQSQTP